MSNLNVKYQPGLSIAIWNLFQLRHLTSNLYSPLTRGILFSSRPENLAVASPPLQQLWWHFHWWRLQGIVGQMPFHFLNRLFLTVSLISFSYHWSWEFGFPKLLFLVDLKNKMFHSYHFIINHHDRSFDHIFQFPNVTWPWVPISFSMASGVNPLIVFPISSAYFLRKMNS